MDMLKQSTPLPNFIIDQSLRYLTLAEIRVLLIVIRQTIGWYDPKTKQRKLKDWISLSFFARRTGLTYKSISLAINGLIEKELIIALDRYQNELRYPQNRRGKKRIYYAYKPYWNERTKKTMVDMITDVFTYPLKTKETLTKKNTRRLSDRERYQEILRHKQAKKRNHYP